MDKIELVRAKPSDIDLIYSWANDPLCRQNSFSNKLIEYSEHVTWYENILKNDKCLFFILTVNGTPCGQIRLLMNDSEALISYSIAKQFRGNNYGVTMLSLAEKEIESYKQIKSLAGYVKEENIASQKSFEKLGYSLEKTNDCRKYFKLVNL